MLCLILLVTVSASPPDHHVGKVGTEHGSGHHTQDGHQGGLIGGGTHDYATHGHQGSHQGSHQGGLIGGGTHDYGTHGGSHQGSVEGGTHGHH